MKLSLRVKLLAPTLCVVALTVALLSWSSYRTAREALISDMELQLQRINSTALGHIESWVGDRKLDVDLLASSPILQLCTQETPAGVESRKAANEEMIRAVKVFGHYDRINITNIKGLAIASSDPQAVGKLDVSDRAYFKEALTGKTVVSEVVISKTSGTPVFMIAAPIRNADQITGVIFGVVGMDSFKRLFVDSTKVLQTGYLYLYDSHGVVIAHPQATQILKLDISKYDWGQNMLRLRSGEISYSYEGIDKITVYSTSASLGLGLAVNVPKSELMAPVKQIAQTNLLLGLLALSLTGAVVYLVTRSIVTPVNFMVKALRSSASQVSEGAGQISAAGQTLASGAAEQAASLEETTAALEEMAGMTQHNADSANAAKDLSTQTRLAAENGESDMRQMITAMDAIKISSDDIAKIIKTIDEIAFQTNILALNAAVEAARAGESGMGFAVVADEVRNLARRSAQAAKETAVKIEGAIAKSTQGVEISAKVQSGLQAIVDKARSVDELISQIATASQEQHQGITQINQAVAQIDKITQANAASAEESASAAESLNGQSDNLNQLVGELVRLSEGDSASPASSHVPQPTRQTSNHPASPVKTSAVKKTTPSSPPKSTLNQPDERFVDN